MKTSLGAKTIVFPTPAFVVGTYDKEGKPNVSTVAWAGICCSKPPCIGISLRKATYTYRSLLEQKAFTVNIPSEEYVEEVDYFGIASGREEDKFAATGLTPVKSDCVSAPYIDEFPLILECRLLNTTELGLHTQFIGEIIDVKVDESMLGKKGLPEVEKIKPIVYMPEVRLYYGVGRLLGRSFSMGKKFKSG
jgi:flavin reductase (DIM6/NTAB) family NADH-FMN oxidoreductase RutF